MSGGQTLGQALAAASARIGGDGARLDAELLLAHAVARSRAWLYAHLHDALDAPAAQRLEALVAARVGGTPIAYLLGRRGFWTLELEVTADTLIPRPETELLVELALQRLPPTRVARVADLGTGSGAIALAIAAERPLAEVIAVDASTAALAVAARNVDALRLHNVSVRHGDWFAPLAGLRFDLIASNPPYIATGDPHLRDGDLRFEPPLALASGIDGLDAIRAIAHAAPAHLHAGGWLLVEHGWEQGPAVREIFARAGLIEVSTARDLEQRERVTLGRRLGIESAGIESAGIESAGIESA